MGTNKMNEWKLKVDNDVMIEVQKQDVIAQDYIKGKDFCDNSCRAFVLIEDSEKSRKGCFRECR